jgi:hypothetical protein
MNSPATNEVVALTVGVWFSDMRVLCRRAEIGIEARCKAAEFGRVL